MNKTGIWARTVAGTALSCVLVGAVAVGGASADASTIEPSTDSATQPGKDGRAAWAYYNKVISRSSTGSYVGSQKLASCGSRTSAMSCSLNKGSSATRTIGLSFGATRSWAAGQLNISSASTQNVSVTCSKRNVPKGKQLVAFPVGVRYKYKIQRHMTGGGKDYVSGTSGWLYAFNPGPARVSCDIRSF
jgi:hypothetical protein